jgi:hypothetical protein
MLTSSCDTKKEPACPHTRCSLFRSTHHTPHPGEASCSCSGVPIASYSRALLVLAGLPRHWNSRVSGTGNRGWEAILRPQHEVCHQVQKELEVGTATGSARLLVLSLSHEIGMEIGFALAQPVPAARGPPAQSSRAIALKGSKRYWRARNGHTTPSTKLASGGAAYSCTATSMIIGQSNRSHVRCNPPRRS